MTAAEYFGRLRRLLELEQEAALLHYSQEVSKQNLQERVRAGFCWSPVRLEQVSYRGVDLWYLRFRNLNKSIEQNHLRTGDVVAVNSRIQTSLRFKAVVVSVEDLHSLELAVTGDLEDDMWQEGEQYSIEQVPDDISFAQMQASLRFWEKLSEHNDKEKLQLFLVLSGQISAEFAPALQNTPSKQLNDSQQQAIYQAMAAKDLALMHGPPGTGKTTSLIELVRLLVNTEKQVLVTAPSNTAVDLLCSRLSSIGLRVLRIGHPARIDEQLWQHTLDAQKQRHPAFKQLKSWYREAENHRRQAAKFKRQFGKREAEARRALRIEAKQLQQAAHQLEKQITSDLLDSAQVICTTLVGAAHELLVDKSFRTAIIDEASQAIEPACWIVAQKARRLIMAGDHCQLPPTVVSEQAAAEGLAVSLFEKLIQIHPRASTMLRVQYRMHEQIMQFSNKQFYGGMLCCAPTIGLHGAYMHNNEALTFIDTAGTGFEEMQTAYASYQNPGEANLLYKHLASWVSTRSVEHPLQVGIISPYQGQVQLLRRLAKAFCLPESVVLRINTVDGFQGQECDVVYVSLVRSNVSGNIGFLSDIRRMNVALTRARYRLIVIGDSSTLAHHHFYAAFLAYVEQHAVYRSAWEWLSE